MKKVVNKETVAHLWANQIQDEARTPNNNFYFNGSAIWSYGSHFCIAKHITNNEGIKAILFTTRKYSVTTSQQINTTRQAVNGEKLIFCPYPSGTHSDNFDQWLKNAEGCHYASKQAKQQRTKLSALSGLGVIENYVNEYCAFFGLDITKESPVLVEALKATDIAGLEEYTAKKELAEAKAKAIRDKELKKRHIQDLKKFRTFKLSSLYVRDGFDYLRFNTESNRIETSQRFEIPLRTAKTFYKQVLDIVKTGNCTLCGGKFMDAYEIKEINKDFIIVGCHKISIKEIQKLANSLNW